MRVNVMLNLFQHPIKIKKEILKRVQDDKIMNFG
jgi:hypothetical protein